MVEFSVEIETPSGVIDAQLQLLYDNGGNITVVDEVDIQYSNGFLHNTYYTRRLFQAMKLNDQYYLNIVVDSSGSNTFTVKTCNFSLARLLLPLEAVP